MPDSKKPADANEVRRKLLKSVAAGGGTFSLKSLPAKWATPVVASVVLPAHAGGSPGGPGGGCVGTIGNCPPGYSDSTNFSNFRSPTFNIASMTSNYPGISYTNGSLDGQGAINSVLTQGPCPGNCGNGSKYLNGSISFGNGGVNYGLTFGYECGGYAVARKYGNFNGTQSGTTGDYSGTKYYSGTACTYLGFGGFPIGGPARFRFGS